jgi:hypothetical protein
MMLHTCTRITGYLISLILIVAAVAVALWRG